MAIWPAHHATDTARRIGRFTEIPSVSQYRRADQNVSLAVAQSSITGQNTFLFSDPTNDRLAYKTVPEGSSVFRVIGSTYLPCGGIKLFTWRFC